MGWTETGVASWYGHPYHGRRSANGEVYDMEQLTAAHPTLPFDAWVRVKNLDHDDSAVEVRITDRGPFVKGRILDLSRGAASRIGMIGPGTARVRLEVIRAPHDAQTAAVFAVQVG
ncbi:MAG: septal ring lytic transglycosylase RlpA family protein, partial [Bryobacteraceae bacterium]